MTETDPQEPRTEQQEETYPCLTIFEANNADTQSLVLGRHEEPEEMTQPELNGEKRAVYVRRWYEPVKIITLPGTLTEDEALEWVDEHRGHTGFDQYDWEAHDEKDALATIVNNRSDFNSFLQHIEHRLMETHVVGKEAKQEIDEIREEIVDAMTNGPGVVLNRVEKPGEAEA